MPRRIAAWAAVGTLGAATALGLGVGLPAGAENDGAASTEQPSAAPRVQEGEAQESERHGPDHSHGDGYEPGHTHGNGHGPGHSHGPGKSSDASEGEEGPPGHVMRGMSGQLVRQAAETLGMDPGELRQRLRSGETLGKVADERGVARADLVAAMLEVHEEQLTELLDRQFPVPKAPPVRPRGERPDDGG